MLQCSMSCLCVLLPCLSSVSTANFPTLKRSCCSRQMLVYAFFLVQLVFLSTPEHLQLLYPLSASTFVCMQKHAWSMHACQSMGVVVGECVGRGCVWVYVSEYVWVRNYTTRKHEMIHTLSHVYYAVKTWHPNSDNDIHMLIEILCVA